MTRHWLVAAVMLFVSGGSEAACIVEPLEEHLQAADLVYVGTVVESALAVPVGGLRDGRRVDIEHTVVPQWVLKGESGIVPQVVSEAVYSDPTSGHSWKWAEAVKVSPGDSILVVQQAEVPPRLALCTPSRRWDAETSDVVRRFFGRAP